MARLENANTQSYNSFLQDEYANLKTIIMAYDKALMALLIGGHQSYQLDTGQSSQRVTRIDIEKLQLSRTKLVAELDALACRIGQNGAQIQVVPGF